MDEPNRADAAMHSVRLLLFTSKAIRPLYYSLIIRHPPPSSQPAWAFFCVARFFLYTAGSALAKYLNNSYIGTAFGSVGSSR